MCTNNTRPPLQIMPWLLFQILLLDDNRRSDATYEEQIILDKRHKTESSFLFLNNNNNNFRVSNIGVSNHTLIYNVCPEAVLT